MARASADAAQAAAPSRQHPEAPAGAPPAARPAPPDPAGAGEPPPPDGGRPAGAAGDGPDRPLVGGEWRVPEAAQGVVQLDGAAAPGSAAASRPAVATAWVFRAHRPPQRVPLAELPQAAAARAADPGAADGRGRRRRPPRPARRGRPFTWVDLSEYGEDDLRAVGGVLRLTEGLERTAVDGWRGPALDVFRDHVYLGATVAHPDGPHGLVQASQLDLFVGRDFLVTAHQRPLPFADRLLARARRSPELVPPEAAFLLYLVLDELLAYYEGLSGPVEDQIERMEERALTETAEAVLTDILGLKRYLFALGRLVEQHRPVFAAFGRPDLPFVPRDVVDPYYRDLQQRLERLLDTLRAGQEAVNGTFDIYVSHMAHRTNTVMRLLTIVSTVLLPASIILALFGTSFEGLPLYTPTAFALMVLALVAVTAAILVTFRRNGWF